jgi:hypothetical protein
MTVWVQFQFHLVVGGTEASRPAEAGTCPGTWVLFDFVKGGGRNGEPVCRHPIPAAISRGRKVWMV